MERQHLTADSRRSRGYVSFFPYFSHKTSFIFQLLQLPGAMTPEDDLCIDKVREMYIRSKLYHLKVGNLQEINETGIPSESFINRHLHAEYFNIMESHGIRHVFLCSINTNKNENTYHIRSMEYQQYVYTLIPAKRSRSPCSIRVQLVYYVVGHVMVLYSPDWTNKIIWFSFILLAVNLFRHPTSIENGYKFTSVYATSKRVDCLDHS